MLSWSRKMFPGTNLQDLNLDWILRKISALRGGSTGQYLYKKSDRDFDFGWKTGGGGGGGGTSDYLDLENKPSINNVELTGNKTAAELGLAAVSDIPAVPVQSVNGQTGDVNLTAADVGAGTYSKPSGGIPKSDLASAVRTSLDKADTALQAVPPAYRTAAAQDAIDAAQDDDIEALAGSLATIESSPATAAHTVGEYIVYNGHLYKVTESIASGVTLTPGTNIDTTTVISAIDKKTEIETVFVTPTDNIRNLSYFAKRFGSIVSMSFTFELNDAAETWKDVDVFTMDMTIASRCYAICMTNEGVTCCVQFFENTNKATFRSLKQSFPAGTALRGTATFIAND